MATAKLFPASLFLVLVVISGCRPQVFADEAVPSVKLNSRILQESIVKQINEDPKAGWVADMSPQFSNYTVGQFKHLLGVKPTPQKHLQGVPLVTHPKSFKLQIPFPISITLSKASTKFILCKTIESLHDLVRSLACYDLHINQRASGSRSLGNEMAVDSRNFRSKTP